MVIVGPSGSVARADDCERDGTCMATAWYTLQPLPSGQPDKQSPARSENDATATGVITSTVNLPLVTKTPLPAATATPTPRQPTPAPTAKHDDGLDGKIMTQTGSISNIMALSAAITSSVTPSPTAVITDKVTPVTSLADALPPDEPEPQLEAAAQPTPAEEIKPLLDAAFEMPPAAAFTCPATSTAAFDLIPIEGQAVRDYPDAVHGDLNLALRGYIPTAAPLEQVDYQGDTDTDAPRLHGLFEPNRPAQITAAYRVNAWIWDSAQCGGHPRGCPGPPTENFWPVTMIGLATQPGETIYAPERSSQIYSGGFMAMVLYAEEKRLTLGYTRRDVVSGGYVVHLENICVNPNLIALYQAQMDDAGWHVSGHLPGIRNNQPLGVALEHELKIAIRDAGTFMDPRSTKDWWR